MIKIALGHNKFAVVDDCDLDLVLAHSWCAHGTKGQQYVHATVNRKELRLHKIIAERMGLSPDCEIDHEDRDRFNCSRSNLREATRAQNLANSSRRNISGYRGVLWVWTKNKYQAKITVKSQSIYLGLFDDPIEAARAYDRAAQVHHGEFASLNNV